jgi:hypothetical protein
MGPDQGVGSVGRLGRLDRGRQFALDLSPEPCRCRVRQQGRVGVQGPGRRSWCRRGGGSAGGLKPDRSSGGLAPVLSEGGEDPGPAIGLVACPHDRSGAGRRAGVHERSQADRPPHDSHSTGHFQQAVDGHAARCCGQPRPRRRCALLSASADTSAGTTPSCRHSASVRRPVWSARRRRDRAARRRAAGRSQLRNRSRRPAGGTGDRDQCRMHAASASGLIRRGGW